MRMSQPAMTWKLDIITILIVIRHMVVLDDNLRITVPCHLGNDDKVLLVLKGRDFAEELRNIIGIGPGVSQQNKGSRGSEFIPTRIFHIERLEYNAPGILRLLLKMEYVVNYKQR